MGAKMNLMRCDYTHIRPQPGNWANLMRERLGHCPKWAPGTYVPQKPCAKGSVSHDTPNLA
jgi:hypothetical protein